MLNLKAKGKNKRVKQNLSMTGLEYSANEPHARQREEPAPRLVSPCRVGRSVAAQLLN